MNKDIAKQLLDMRDADQSARASGRIDSKLDRANARSLKKIIAAIGWPNRETVGEEASVAAWLIAQHADFWPDFQEACLKEMRRAARKGLADESLLAYLTDRVRVNTGGRQVYGTQWYKDKKTGKMRPRPIRSRKQAERLRKKLGLPTLKKYGERLQEIQNKLQKKAT